AVEWCPTLAASSGSPPDAGSPWERPHVIADMLTPLALNDRATVAVVGDGAALVRSLLVQLATTTGPADWEPLVIVEQPDGWRWCDWLPHAGGDGERRCLDAEDDAAIAATLDVLDADDERTVVLVTDRPELLVARTGALRRFLAGRRRCALVVLVPLGGAVPSVCTTVVDIGSRGRARWTPDATVAPPHRGLHLVGVTIETATLVARRLAGLVDPESPGGARDAIPRRVRLSDVLETGVAEITPAAVEQWWAVNDTAQHLATPLGIGDGVVGVDLVADGPHALIAGTTGAGKSELLRVLVSGLAARYAPARLNVVLVDFKGGATFDACALVPHTVGVVTDLDDQLAERALISLRAELKWREQWLRDVGATDLVEYDERVGAVGRPAPGRSPGLPPVIARLVVVIDEFAALAAELPEFLHALVGIAQRGRSLGVHLILATQRPSGVVSDDIRANTNLRIALRLHDVADARDVVDDDAPAGFARGVPGRAMLRLGAQERIVFQAASGAWPERRAPAQRVMVVDHTPTDAMLGTAELDVLVRSVCEVADRSQLTPRHRPWLEPLPDVLAADGFDGSGIEPGAIGLIDVPDQQCRRPLRWTPGCGNLALYGSRGSGTTSTLITLVDTLARRLPVTRLHVYVVDTIGENRLDELRRLPHCGDVIRVGDHERLRRFVAYLSRELETRRSGSRGGVDPDIIWCVDGVGALRADDGLAFGVDAVGERLATLLADGPSVGIVGVLTVAPGRSSAMSLGACANRWLFHLDDAGDAMAAGARSSQVPPAVAGRLFDAGSQRFAQVVAPRAIEIRPAPARCLPAPVSFGTLPASIGVDQLAEQSRYDPVTGESQLVLGAGFDDLDAVAVQVPDGEHVVVAGRARSGRSSVLCRLIGAWRQCHPAARVVVVAPDSRSPVAAMSELAEPGDVAGLNDGVAGDRLLLVVDDAERYDDVDGSMSSLIERRRSGLCVVAAIRPEALRGEYTHWTRLVRRSRIGVVLTAGGEPDGDVVGEQLPRRMPIAARPGLAYVVAGGTAQLVQVARPEP
ncbi:MAG: FtsK/SpoIIIE domain-containing protein, partial [Actinomycetota bacterium]|nr:FtsK/SpoIIIE domain-containing protein [Actinomycetota bacterium]